MHGHLEKPGKSKQKALPELKSGRVTRLVSLDGVERRIKARWVCSARSKVVSSSGSRRWIGEIYKTETEELEKTWLAESFLLYVGKKLWKKNLWIRSVPCNHSILSQWKEISLSSPLGFLGKNILKDTRSLPLGKLPTALEHPWHFGRSCSCAEAGWSGGWILCFITVGCHLPSTGVFFVFFFLMISNVVKLAVVSLRPLAPSS